MPPFFGLLFSTPSEHASIPLSILLIFGTAKLLAEVFERLGQPGIVGEILAGVLIGPSVLGWVHPNEVLTTLAELGVMFLLFRVGLEVKASELIRVGGTASVVACLGVIVPFGLGWAIMHLWGAATIESVFVGAAMVATSVGITAQVLASKGLLDHQASRIILAAAVIDDVLGLIVLAIVSSLARGSVNVAELGLTALAAIAFTLVVAKWGTRAMGEVVPRLERRLSAGEVQFNLAIIFLFGLALLAIYAGVAAIIGAFLARYGAFGNARTSGSRPGPRCLGIVDPVLPGGNRIAPGIVCLLEHGDRTALRGHSAGSGDFEDVGLRTWRLTAWPGGCIPGGRRYGAAGRSRHGGGADRPGFWSDSTAGLRGGGLYGGGHNDTCSPAAEYRLSRSCSREAGGRV